MTYCHYGHCYCGRCHRPSSPLPFSVLLFLALALMLLALSSLIKIEIDMESTGDSMTWLVLLAALAILVVVRFLSANSCRQPHYCGCGRCAFEVKESLKFAWIARRKFYPRDSWKASRSRDMLSTLENRMFNLEESMGDMRETLEEVEGRTDELD
ncbi:hypothetical protein Gotur_029720 [Gossypium turneri]